MIEAAARTDLIRELLETRDAFLAGVSGVTAEQATFKPAPDRWSIEEVAEHLALVEARVLERLSRESTPAERMERTERQTQLREMGMDRAMKRQAPEMTRPTGRFGSMPKALAQFVANRDKTIAYLNECSDDLHARTVVHPIATMTCHEFVVMMSGHTLRHLAQVREIQTTPGYPA